MECDKLSASWIGDEILPHYSQWSGDRLNPDLIAFFKAYRACVRAKVCLLRGKQLTGTKGVELQESAVQYLRLAEQYCDQLGPPVLVVVRGLSGTGKSTVATNLRG